MQHDTEIHNSLHENLAIALPVTSDGGTESKEDGTVPSFPQKKKSSFMWCKSKTAVMKLHHRYEHSTVR
jgi:hypothetical protein